MNRYVQAFLALIAWSEGTIGGLDGGYGVIVASVAGPATFTDYSRHPFDGTGRHPQLVRPAGALPALYSTASGRYQINLPTWHEYKARLSLTDFSHASQDAVAIDLIRRNGGIPAVLSGDAQKAAQQCRNVWASLPGNAYAQGGHTMPVLLQQWAKLTGTQQVQA